MEVIESVMRYQRTQHNRLLLPAKKLNLNLVFSVLKIFVTLQTNTPTRLQVFRFFIHVLTTLSMSINSDPQHHVKSLSLSSHTELNPKRRSQKLSQSISFTQDLGKNSFCDQLRHWREQYEQRTGGTRGVKAHFLTNRFYLDPHIEMSYQEWCTTEQLPPSRVLLLVMVSGLVLYQGYSALKTKQPAVWVGFAFRIGATVALALIVVALYFIRIAQKYWKYLLSLGIVILLGIECYYRSVKLKYEGELLTMDCNMILQNSSILMYQSIQNKVESKTFSSIFSNNKSNDPMSVAVSFGKALNILQDEVLLWQNRPWPMWTVIMSVVLRIDIFLIVPAMVTVLIIYLTSAASYSTDIQTMVLLICQLFLLIYLGGQHDRFLRWTYIQMEDSKTENTSLRERLKILSHKGNYNGEDSEVIITTPMENVMHKLNKIRAVLEQDTDLGSSLGPILENVIDTLGSTNMTHHGGDQRVSTFDKLNKLAGVDADVTSWLINQAGLGDRYVRHSTSDSVHSTSDSSFSTRKSKTHMVIPEELLELDDQVMTFLGDLQDWDLDVLELKEMTNGKPLLVLASAIVSRNDLLLSIFCSNQTFFNFITKIESGYLQNPYHNSAHAADVLNGCHHFIQALKLKDVVTTHQMFSLLIAAAIHDFEHPGVSNNFLVKTKHKLALEYNDDSVCERMHVARAFAIMHEEDAHCNILKGVSDEDYVSIRRTIIDNVMVTDLSKHLDYTARIRSMASNSKNNNPMLDAKVLMQIAIKSSDLGHCAKKLNTHIKWTELITEEMYLQGDLEKQLGCKVSAFCDREAGNIPKSQVGFFTVIINPFFSAIVDLDARFDPIKQAVLKNYQHWRQESGEASTKRRLSHIKLILNGEDINDDQTEEEKENKSEAVTIEIDPNAEEKVTAFDNTDTSSFDETKSKSKETKE